MAWLVLVGLGAIGRAVSPEGYVVAAVTVAEVVAVLALGDTLASVWRGPPVVEFAAEDGLWCDEEDSEPVRAYAQLRGTIGGAGHVHPRRIGLPLLAWAAALLAGGRHIFWPELETLGAVPAALAATGAFAAWLFPSRPYWYREVMGGGAMVSPPEAVAALLARERGESAPALAAIHETGRAADILRHSPVRLVEEAGAPAECEVVIDSSGRLRALAPGEVLVRPARYPLSRKLVVEQDGVAIQLATVNVSTGGMAVRWMGELPVVGADVVVKLAEDDTPLETVVCWNRVDPERDERTVGLRIEADGDARERWQEVVARAARARAPVA